MLRPLLGLVLVLLAVPVFAAPTETSKAPPSHQKTTKATKSKKVTHVVAHHTKPRGTADKVSRNINHEANRESKDFNHGTNQGSKNINHEMNRESKDFNHTMNRWSKNVNHAAQGKKKAKPAPSTPAHTPTNK